ncbi:MAG: hypothetical protein JWO50_710 [Candidatus Kaiserbacteria bacterium]|nr:hypothetical protein [Candidatus Kaiserbacteria bacterium]
MSTPKIVGLVSACKDCTNYTYYSGGVYVCRIVDQAVIEKDEVAPFCPLTDFPSRTIANMGMTILGLRKTNDYSMGFALLSYVATRFKVSVEANGTGVVLAVDDGRKICLSLHYVEKVNLDPAEIRFKSGDDVFRACLDGKKPTLLKRVVSNDESEELWTHIL